MDPLQELIAIEQIKKLKAQYCRFSDTRDDERFETLFTEDIVWKLMGADGVTVLKEIRGKAEQHSWRASMREARLAGTSVHHCHTPEITILDENNATGIWAVADYLRQPVEGKNFKGYGHYHEEYRREDGRWLISKLTVTRLRVDPLEMEPPDRTVSEKPW